MYFPGWVCRYYVTSDVPPTIISQLRALGAEILDVPPGMAFDVQFMLLICVCVDSLGYADVDTVLIFMSYVCFEDKE